MNNKLLITAILFIAATALFGQKEYLDGYVIMEQGDTVFGKLAVLSEIKSCKQIEFLTPTGEKRKFKARKKEIKAYQRGNEYFVRKPVTTSGFSFISTGFMKILATGKVNLYRFDYLASSSSAGGGTVNYANKIFFLEKNGRIQPIKNSGFFVTMISYFSDNSEFREKIKNKEFKYEDIERIVKIYNMEASMN